MTVLLSCGSQRLGREMPKIVDTLDDALADAGVVKAIARGLIEIKGDRVTYNLSTKKTYGCNDPEELNRPGFSGGCFV
jgi:hypothetical protein